MTGAVVPAADADGPPADGGEAPTVGVGLPLPAAVASAVLAPGGALVMPAAAVAGLRVGAAPVPASAAVAEAAAGEPAHMHTPTCPPGRQAAVPCPPPAHAQLSVAPDVQPVCGLLLVMVMAPLPELPHAVAVVSNSTVSLQSVVFM